MRTPPSPALAEALHHASARLHDGNDAYADEDVIRELFDAASAYLDGDVPVRAELVRLLRVVVGLAQDAATPDPEQEGKWRIRSSGALRDISVSALALLQAIALAPHDDAAFMPDDERGAVVKLVEAERERADNLARRAVGLEDFLDELASEFEGANTPVSLRVAARVRTALERVG